MFKNKVFIFFLVFVLMFVPALAQGQTMTSTVGHFTLLKKGDPAPFAGTLLDQVSTALILVDKEQMQKEHQNEIIFLEKRLKLDFQMKFDEMSVQQQIDNNTNQRIIKIKDEQIQELEEMVKGGTDWTWLWVSLALIAGVAVGVGSAALYERLQ